MSEEFIKKTPPLDVKSEGREFRRFGQEGSVLLKFDSNAARGDLINISTGGVLGGFSSSDPLPQIHQNVMVDLEVDEKIALQEIKGTVIRIQPAITSGNPEYIEIAVKFVKLDPGKKHIIRNIVNSLLKRAGGHPYFD